MIRPLVLLTALATADSYTAIVTEYHQGDATAALERLARLEKPALDAGLSSLGKAAPALSEAAAALHTEAALRPGHATPPQLTGYHLDLATAIVELGQPATPGKAIAVHSLSGSALSPVSPAFRRSWYLTVVTALEGGGAVAVLQPYLARARQLYPADPEVLLLSAMADETRASPRVEDLDKAERVKSLVRAEADLRAVVAANPERLEAHLRLGHVLQTRGDPSARDILIPLTEITRDERLNYLAALFLGASFDADGDAAAAAAWYERAAARSPTTQAAALALSELRFRAGDVKEAAAAIPRAIGEANSADPWWSYVFGEHWRARLLLDNLRRMGRR